MKRPKYLRGSDTVTPDPLCNALQAIAQSLYAIRLDTGNPKGEWLAVPRPVVELAIDLLIDWLDLMDRLGLPQPDPAQICENAL